MNKFIRFKPIESQIQKIIEDAKNHPLGLDFLMEGDLLAVAMTFEAHAFTVEAARKKLTKNPIKGSKQE